MGLHDRTLPVDSDNMNEYAWNDNWDNNITADDLASCVTKQGMSEDAYMP